MSIQTEIISMPLTDVPIKLKTTNNKIEEISASPHLHKEIELIYLLSGSMDFYISGQTIHMEKGDIIFVNSHTAHSTHTPQQIKTEIILLQFDPNIIYNFGLLSDFKYLIPFLASDSTRYFLFHYKSSSCTELQAFMQKISDEFKSKEVAYEIAIRSTLYSILTILYRCGALDFNYSQNILRKQEILERIRAVLEFIEKNYDRSICVEDACKLLNLNYHYFCRLFRRATGKSFMEYLTFIRISAAEKLMLSTLKPMTEIIMETGFSSISYFNRVFKHLKGVTPSNYRKMLKQNTGC